MFEKGLLAGKRILVTGGGSGLGAAMGRRFARTRRRADHLRPPARIAGADRGANAQRDRRQGLGRAMRYPRRRRRRGDDGCGLGRGADRRAGQQRRRDLHRANRTSVLSGRGCDPGADAARHDVLHARGRQTLDRGQAQGRGAEHSLDFDHHRACLHGAFGDGKDRRAGDDQKPCGGMGSEGRPHGRDRAPAPFRPRAPRASCGPRAATKAGRIAIRSAAPANTANSPIWRAF